MPNMPRTGIGRVATSVLLFASAACFGPLLQWMTWPPSQFEARSSPEVTRVVSQVIFLLWPTQAFAVVETTTGTAAALALAVLSNVALFGLIGVVVGVGARSRGMIWVLFGFVAALVLLIALWESGFSPRSRDFPAFAIALAGYAIPFAAMCWLQVQPRGPISRS